jgi:hypothetical protein
MSREIVQDYNNPEDEAVVKKLSSPKRNTVITGNTSVRDLDDDLASLNGPEESGSQRVMGDRESGRVAAPETSGKKTLLGNEGPDSSGKIDFTKSPDSMDALIQYHESYKFTDDEAGFTATAQKCFRQFNRLFSSKTTPCKVTEEEIAAALLSYYKTNPNPEGKLKSMRKSEAAASQGSPAPSVKTVAQPVVTYVQLNDNKALKINNIDKSLPLTGEKFEICKILNCKNICLVQKQQGAVEANNVFYAACGNTLGEPASSVNPEGCPQEAPLSAKDKMALEMFKAQFDGDELKAKKFLFVTKTLYK